MRFVSRADGETYLAASMIRHEDGYEDVPPALLRTWVHDGHLTVVTVAELAAAFGHRPPPNVDGTAPAQAKGPSGPENVYRWADIVRCETARRQARAGRPRGRAPHAEQPPS